MTLPSDLPPVEPDEKESAFLSQEQREALQQLLTDMRAKCQPLLFKAEQMRAERAKLVEQAGMYAYRAMGAMIALGADYISAEKEIKGWQKSQERR